MQAGRQVWIPRHASSLRDYRLAPPVLAGEVAAKMTAAQHLPGAAESTALLNELLALRTGVKDDQLLAVAAYNELGRVYEKGAVTVPDLACQSQRAHLLRFRCRGGRNGTA